MLIEGAKTKMSQRPVQGQGVLLVFPVSSQFYLGWPSVGTPSKAKVLQASMEHIGTQLNREEKKLIGNSFLTYLQVPRTRRVQGTPVHPPDLLLFSPPAYHLYSLSLLIYTIHFLPLF